MSQEKFVKFYQEFLPKHDDVRKRLDSCKHPDEFSRIAIEEGTKAGFDFAKGDVEEVMKASTGVPGAKGLKVNVSAVSSGLVSHDLSDEQLGAVGGGTRNVYAGCCW
jgi:hypothetical protein